MRANSYNADAAVQCRGTHSATAAAMARLHMRCHGGREGIRDEMALSPWILPGMQADDLDSCEPCHRLLLSPLFVCYFDN
eukprot:SAG31_NODE_1995_length_6708_cov_49.258889_3_plen_80_part_00